ncbi:MAG: hypothetical protein LRY39_01370 [Alphaproteobacteria bacterium]|nr:hypothetical protein [Alphaproteobacteria bacterium]
MTVGGRGGSDITLSPLDGGQSKTSTSAHEFVHTRQRNIWQAGWYGMIWYNSIEHVGQHEKQGLSRSWRQLTRKTLDMANYTPGIGAVGTYFARNEEMQARMQEILAMGYQQWQKMPLNKTELWAALINFGMSPPKAVREHMETPEGKDALAEFKVLESIRKSMAGTVGTFKTIQAWAGDDDVKQALWDVQYPLLYGELLEMYGDIPGRARMKLGSNPRPSIEISSYLKSFAGRMPEEHAWDIARKIPNDQVIPLVNNLIHLASGLHDIKNNNSPIARRRKKLFTGCPLFAGSSGHKRGVFATGTGEYSQLFGT